MILLPLWPAFLMIGLIVLAVILKVHIDTMPKTMKAARYVFSDAAQQVDVSANPAKKIFFYGMMALIFLALVIFWPICLAVMAIHSANPAGNVSDEEQASRLFDDQDIDDALRKAVTS